MRRKLTESVEADILHACRRKCCICYFLCDERGVRKGQLAHLDKDSSNNSKANIVYLCFDHHDEFDSRTSQSKGLTKEEVRRWRDKLVDHIQALEQEGIEVSQAPAIEPERDLSDDDQTNANVWRFPLWLIANQPELYAYKARNGADGICAIERIDLPDGRIVIVCTQVPGNPGQSITNAAEYICEEICERFSLNFDQIVWLEAYQHSPIEWNRVVFGRNSQGKIIKPTWYSMSELNWQDLGLRPIGPMPHDHLHLLSNVEKLFPWPTEAIL